MPKCSGQCFEGRQSVFKEGGRADLKDAAMRPETHVFEGLTAAAYASFSVADVTRKIKNFLIKTAVTNSHVVIVAKTARFAMFMLTIRADYLDRPVVVNSER